MLILIFAIRICGSFLDLYWRKIHMFKSASKVQSDHMVFTILDHGGILSNLPRPLAHFMNYCPRSFADSMNVLIKWNFLFYCRRLRTMFPFISAPGPPTILINSSTTHNTLNVTWSGPHEDNIHRFFVEYRQLNRSDGSTKGISFSPYDIRRFCFECRQLNRAKCSTKVIGLSPYWAMIYNLIPKANQKKSLFAKTRVTKKKSTRQAGNLSFFLIFWLYIQTKFSKEQWK